MNSKFVISGILIVMLICVLQASAPAADKIKGLHVERGGSVSGRYNLSDKHGNTWDIYCSYGTIYNGTNYLYSQALRLYVNGNYFRAGSSWRDKKSQEVECGPWSNSGVTVHRRLKVFRDKGMVRWLDIYTNTTSTEKNVSLRLQTQLNHGISQKKSSSGKGSFTSKDFAMWTKCPADNIPATLHIPHGPKTKSRVNVNCSGNNITYTYQLKIAPGQTAIVAWFEGQNHNSGTLDKLMKSFTPSDYFNDLPPRVRKLIRNFRVFQGIMDIELDRVSSSDKVSLLDGNPIYGSILNKGFKLISSFGELNISASQMFGMKVKQGSNGDFLVILSDGQIVSGRLPNQKLKVEVPAIGALEIPMEDISGWAFKSTEDNTKEIPFTGPYLLMRSGDRLIFKPGSVQLRLQTRNGEVELDGNDIYQIVLSNAGHSVHKVLFLNDSVLTGLLEPSILNVDLDLKPGQKIIRNDLIRIDFSPDTSKGSGMTFVAMKTGDKFFGRLVEDDITLNYKYGSKDKGKTITIPLKNIKSISEDSTRKGNVIIEDSRGSKFPGTIAEKTLKFEIIPGPVIHISPIQIKQLIRSKPMLPKEIRNTVKKLVAQLGSESFKDRNEAQKKLESLGENIIPQLKEYLNSKDPEIRNRIKRIIDELGGDTSNTGAGTTGNTNAMIRKVIGPR